MEIERTPFEGLYILRPRVFSDERGNFYESFNRKEFLKVGISADFVQDNQSTSKKGVIRGLHFQVAPYEQGKIVRVLRGSALDVAVDLRRDSPTFGKHFSMILQADIDELLWIPPGFAHGFASLEDDTLFTYKVTNYYERDAERGIRFDDPDLNIAWNISSPIVSRKDLIFPGFKEWKQQ